MQPATPHQISLAPEQAEVLQHLATQQGRSFSMVAHEVVRLGLELMQHQSRQQALERLHQIRSQLQQTHRVYAGDLIAEVRHDRQVQQVRLEGQ